MLLVWLSGSSFTPPAIPTGSPQGETLQPSKVFSTDPLPIVPALEMSRVHPLVKKWADDITEYLRKLRVRIGASLEIISTAGEGTQVLKWYFHYSGTESELVTLIDDTRDWREWDFAVWMRSGETLNDIIDNTDSTSNASGQSAQLWCSAGWSGEEDIIDILATGAGGCRTLLRVDGTSISGQGKLSLVVQNGNSPSQGDCFVSIHILLVARPLTNTSKYKEIGDA